MSQQDNTKVRILYLEDNPKEVLEHLISIRKTFGAAVSLATSYSEAEQLLKTETFHLFILDIELENERASGILLAQQLRQSPLYSHTPIIFTSMHTHFSHRLVTSLSHCVFLSKPFSIEALMQHVGVALNVPQYVQAQYGLKRLLLAVRKGTHMEIDPRMVSYIEVQRYVIQIQYMNGEQISVCCEPGSFKKLLMQIDEKQIDYLRQIYRSIAINVDQIRSIELRGNAGDVWLFGDREPKPLGIQYRKNVKEFLQKGAIHEGDC